MRPPLLSAIALSLALASCAGPGPPNPSAPHLLTGAHSPLGAAALEAARALARGFGRAYARSIYDPTPPRLPATTPAVARTLRNAASRIPPSRRGLNPRLAALTLRPLDRRHSSVAVTIEDGHSPPFSVGFSLERRDGRWLVTAISPPG